MLSSVYRQASAATATALRRDPENRLFSRMPRQRLEGEAIRDAMLAASGRLNLKMGGPSVFPPLPKGLGMRGSWPVTADPRERDRRSVYVFVRRNLRYPLFQTFDMPDTHEPCARRMVTTTAPQSLMLLNDDVVLDLAQSFAGRLLAGEGVTRNTSTVIGPAVPITRYELRVTSDALVTRAYRLAYGRLPSAEERGMARQFLERQAAIIRDRAARGVALALPEPAAPGIDPVEAAAVVDFCHALFNTNEFVYVD